MKGKPRTTQSDKEARGTLRPVRDNDFTDISVPDDMPRAPDSLTTEGIEVWQDNVGRAVTVGLFKEIDSEVFANWCNLGGAIRKAWRSGEVPPIAALTEHRRLSELIGVAGGKSRVVDKNVITGESKPANPFAKHARRSPKG